jgi:hypothetical protein
LTALIVWLIPAKMKLSAINFLVPLLLWLVVTKEAEAVLGIRKVVPEKQTTTTTTGKIKKGIQALFGRKRPVAVSTIHIAIAPRTGVAAVDRFLFGTVRLWKDTLVPVTVTVRSSLSKQWQEMIDNETAFPRLLTVYASLVPARTLQEFITVNLLNGVALSESRQRLLTLWLENLQLVARLVFSTHIVEMGSTAAMDVVLSMNDPAAPSTSDVFLRTAAALPVAYKQTALILFAANRLFHLVLAAKKDSSLAIQRLVQKYSQPLALALIVAAVGSVLFIWEYHYGCLTTGNTSAGLIAIVGFSLVGKTIMLGNESMNDDTVAASVVVFQTATSAVETNDDTVVDVVPEDSDTEMSEDNVVVDDASIKTTIGEQHKAYALPFSSALATSQIPVAIGQRFVVAAKAFVIASMACSLGYLLRLNIPFLFSPVATVIMVAGILTEAWFTFNKYSGPDLIRVSEKNLFDAMVEVLDDTDTVLAQEPGLNLPLVPSQVPVQEVVKLAADSEVTPHCSELQSNSEASTTTTSRRFETVEVPTTAAVDPLAEVSVLQTQYFEPVNLLQAVFRAFQTATSSKAGRAPLAVGAST